MYKHCPTGQNIHPTGQKNKYKKIKQVQKINKYKKNEQRYEYWYILCEQIEQKLANETLNDDKIKNQNVKTKTENLNYSKITI